MRPLYKAYLEGVVRLNEYIIHVQICSLTIEATRSFTLDLDEIASKLKLAYCIEPILSVDPPGTPDHRYFRVFIRSCKYGKIKVWKSTNQFWEINR